MPPPSPPHPRRAALSVLVWVAAALLATTAIAMTAGLWASRSAEVSVRASQKQIDGLRGELGRVKAQRERLISDEDALRALLQQEIDALKAELDAVAKGQDVTVLQQEISSLEERISAVSAQSGAPGAAGPSGPAGASGAPAVAPPPPSPATVLPLPSLLPLPLPSPSVRSGPSPSVVITSCKPHGPCPRP